jgi:Carboxypeptidase regulatory-like domain/TonB-dependent Receptor Plug Domain/TonB dependent receptor
MTMRKTAARGAAIALALVGLLAGATADAQVTTGTITGTVRDPQGAAVPGATVTITNQGQGTSSTHTTATDGSFVAPFLIPGTYDVTVELAGFRKFTHKGVVLQVNQRARVDAGLEVGGLTEATEVVGLAPLTRTDSAEMGDVIDERAVRELPLNGRNFASLVYLAPGITPGQAGENLSGASTFNPRGASNFNALGSQANTNAWLVDGIDNNEFTFNTVIVQPTVESVREFKVLTGTFSAEFGRGAGVVSVSTKSGNNEWHGTVFEYLRNEKFDAKNFFALPTAPKAPLDRHQYGASLSGPIIKNKTFFFVDYSGIKEDRGQVFVNTVPTDAMKRGDFSDYRDRNGNLILIYDPLTTAANPAGGFTRQPFPGNVIPADRLDSVGMNVGSIYPSPNGPGAFDNYTSTVDRTVRDNSFTGRIDHRAGDRDSFFVRFSYEKYSLDAPQGQAACCLPTPDAAAAAFDLGPFVAGIQNTRLTTHGGVINWTHLFGPTVVNELRIGYAKTNPETRQSDYGHESATSLGIQGINVSEYTTGLPNLNIQDVTGISGGPAFLPVNPKQIHYQIEDTLSWVTGRHSLKTGYRFILRKPTPFTHTNTRSSIAINRNLTNNPATNSQGSGFATLLLGYTTGGSRGFLLDFYDYTNSEHSIFVQDDWKLSNRVTVNLGLRYEVYVPDTEAENRLPNYDVEGMRLVYAGEDGTSERANKETRWGNLAPRIGVAWDVTGDAKNVLRAGYGRSYFPVPHAAGNLLDQNVPNSISQNYSVETNPLVYTPDRVPRLSNPFPAIVPVKPITTADLNAANPIVFGHAFSNETPHMDTWQVSYERQLTNTLMAEVAYVGSKGSNLIWVGNINEVQPGPGTQASRRLIQPLSNVTQVLYFDTNNRSSYNSLQAKLNKRFSNGLQFLAAYTFGKSLDYAGAPASGGGAVGGPQSVTLFDESRGPSGFDVKHRFVLSWVWALPFGEGHSFADSGILKALLENWQFGGIVTLSSGRPFTVFLNTGVNNGAPSWPNRIGDGKLDDPTPELWFDVADFVAPPPNTYGDSGRGILTAPGTQTIDVSLSRAFPIKAFRLQFRVDAFNLFNTPQFGFPNQNIGSPTAGRITTTLGDNRSMQFALKLDW